MDKAIANALAVDAECHEAAQAALLNLADACRDGDKLSFYQAETNVLATWLRNKNMIECTFLKLLSTMVEQSPEDYGGEEYLAEVRRRVAQAEASLDELN